MTSTLEINPQNLSEQALELILAKAVDWQTSPAEAMARLLDELACNSKKEFPEPG